MRQLDTGEMQDWPTMYNSNLIATKPTPAKLAKVSLLCSDLTNDSKLVVGLVFQSIASRAIVKEATSRQKIHATKYLLLIQAGC